MSKADGSYFKEIEKIGKYENLKLETEKISILPL